jgi:hypothetical protein
VNNGKLCSGVLLVCYPFLYLFCLLLLIISFCLSFLSGKIFRESFAGIEVVAENESESHTTDQTHVVDNLHYLESASSFTEHLHFHTLDYHDIMINLLLGCSYDTNNDVFSTACCSWICDYYCLLAVNRESFWRTVGTESHEGISHFLLKSFQCISPEIMMNIYGIYCGLSKEYQRMLLSCCYSVKCWRENRMVLRSDDFLAYSPSYFPEYQDNNNDSTFNCIYMNSSQVQLGVKFGCARCMELSSLGQSKLKHLEDCPFTVLGFDVASEELSVASTDGNNSALQANDRNVDAVEAICIGVLHLKEILSGSMPESSINEKLANEGKDLQPHIVEEVKDMYESAYTFSSEDHFGMVDAAVANHFSSFLFDYEIVDIINDAAQVGRIVVDQSQILFSRFHSFVMKAGYYSKGNELTTA